MPIYEYEPTDHDCLICPGRIEVIQGIQDAPLEFCPHCGLGVKRVVSRAQFSMRGGGIDYEKAGQRGLTTYRKVEKGKWEKIGGEGADMMVGSKEDMAKIEAEKAAAKKPPKVLDLDKAD